MKRLGIYKTRDGKVYDLIYFPKEGVGQAVGPIPKRVGAAGVAAEDAGRKAQEHGMKELDVRVKGPGSGRTGSATVCRQGPGHAGRPGDTVCCHGH